MSLVGLLGGIGRFLVVKDLTFGRLELGEVVFVSMYRASIFLVQIRLVMEIGGVKPSAVQRSPESASH